MQEKSATAAQTAPSRPPVKAGNNESLLQKMQRLNDAISRRAFELFEQDGRADGHDRRHWLQAEQELLHPMFVSMDDSESEITLHAEVPGFTADDLEVNVETRRVTIAGKRASVTKKETGGSSYTRECSDEIFQAIDLASDVNSNKVSANLKDGILNIRLPKVLVTQPSPAEPQLP